MLRLLLLFALGQAPSQPVVLTVYDAKPIDLEAHVKSIEESAALREQYDLDNGMYWRGRLPRDIIIGYADLTEEQALGITYWSAGKAVAIAIDKPLKTYSTTLSNCVLIHEEVHVRVGLNAKPGKFRKVAFGIIKAGGCPGLLGGVE